jgi:probable HAF family extracellular repeat protein
MSISVMMLLAAPVTSVRLAAQDQQDHNSHVRYTVKDLGTLGGTFSEAVGINNNGSMAGFSTPPGDLVVHAALWQHGVITDLGTLGGPDSVAPEAEPQPNARGEVAGGSDTSVPDPNGEDFCGFGTHLICLPFIWKKGVQTALPTLGGNNGIAGEINNRGEAVGSAETPNSDPCSPGTNFLQFEGAIWEKGSVQELRPLPGDPDGVATGINDHGQAVGGSGCYPKTHAVLWPNPPYSDAVDLGNLGGTEFNVAFGINNRGHVVGQSGVPDGINFHAFLWTKNDGMKDLGTLPGDVQSWAETINSKEQAVGTSFDANGNMHPYIWQDGVTTNLNALIPPDAPWLLLEALGNNDRGQIVGYGVRTDIGEIHAYVATPCGVKNGDSKGCGELVAVTHDQAAPVLSGAASSMVRFLGRRSMLWHRNLGAQTQPK